MTDHPHNKDASSPIDPLADNLDRIKVCVRVRPHPADDDEPLSWSFDRQTVTMIRPSRRNSSNTGAEEHYHEGELPSYSYDYLFLPEDDNAQIYTDLCKGIVDKSLQGYHGCIFTYGQTASGKTFTMNGSAKSPGLIPHASFDLFEMAAAMKDRVFCIKLAYLELYREQVLDLLNPDTSASAAIKILYDPKVGTVIQGLLEEEVTTPQQIMMLLQRGESLRHVGVTDMNEKSSRSHVIFRLIIESRGSSPTDKTIRKSTLNLIDLAGSENARMTNALGDRAKEAKFINQSLLTLSTIIQRLGEVSGGGHLPFRDSKLTRILQVHTTAYSAQ
jgi:centromeric protein E